MSEMLANRYFIARQFDKAIPHLETALRENAPSDKIKKKLIICYIQDAKTERAFSLFYELVTKDPRIISDTDVLYDDCPCFELIPSWQKKMDEADDKSEILNILAMLFLYCDVQKSIDYFKRSSKLTGGSPQIQTILDKLQTLKSKPE